MKNLFISVAVFFLLMLPGAVMAQAYSSIAVQRHDGSEFIVQGEKGISLVFSENEMRFVSSSSQYIAFPLSEVKGWYLSTKDGDNNWSAIDDRVADSVTVTRLAGSVQLDNLPAGSTVMLTSLSGMVISRANAEGSHTISLAGLTPGLYMLTYNNVTLKIAVNP